jgi:hypothetical protein
MIWIRLVGLLLKRELSLYPYRVLLIGTTTIIKDSHYIIRELSFIEYFKVNCPYGNCPSSESNSALDGDDTERSPDAEESRYFLSREPGSFGSGKAASRSCLGCFASLLVSLLPAILFSERFYYASGGLRPLISSHVDDLEADIRYNAR